MPALWRAHDAVDLIAAKDGRMGRGNPFWAHGQNFQTVAGSQGKKLPARKDSGNNAGAAKGRWQSPPR